MAQDLTVDYQTRLRALNRYSFVNDLFLLEIALKLGSVDAEGEPHYPTYRETESVSDSQLLMMLDGVADLIKEIQVSSGEAVGLVSAHSISEPITQAVMRTFHYAGVLTKESPLIRLDEDVSMRQPKYIALAIALKPPYNKDPEKVKELAYQLSRTPLSKYAHITMDNLDFVAHQMKAEMNEIEARIKAFDGPRFVKMTKTQFTQRKKRMAAMGIDLIDEFSNEYTPEFQALIDERAGTQARHLERAIEASKDNVFTVYLKKDSIMTTGELRRCLNLQFKNGDGSFRTYGKPGNPLYYVYKNASLTESFETTYEGEEVFAIQVSFPNLPKGHFIQWVERMGEIETCNNCRWPVTVASLKPTKKSTSSEVMEDPDWDTGAPVDSYYEKVLESLRESGYKPNPPELEEDSTGLIEIPASEFDNMVFRTADRRESKLCPNCEHGWLHFNYEEWGGNPIGNLLVGPINQAEGMTTVDPLAILTPQQENDPFTTHDSQPTALFKDRSTMAGDRFGVYPGLGNTPGLNEMGRGLSDYNLQHGEDGFMVANPQNNEYFIQAFISNGDRTGSRYGGFIGKEGGWLGAVKSCANGVLKDKLDFDRTTCNDVRQVESVLGIEAARTVVFHKLIESVGDAGETHLKHALLLADAMCAHNTVMTAPKGRGSIAGLNSQMGNRTEFMSDGSIVNYGSVLAQAYERQVQVVLRRSIQGMVDDLEHVKSSAIAGDPGMAKFGTMSGAAEGKFSSPTLDVAMRAFADYSMGKENGKQNLDQLLTGRANSALIEGIKDFQENLLREMDILATQLTGLTWKAKLMFTPELAAQDTREVSILQKQKWEQVMKDDGFIDLFEQYGVLEELLVYILNFMTIV